MSTIPRSPYAHLDEAQVSKLQAVVSTEDKLLLQSICPQRGLLLYIVESITFSLVNDLKHHGINHYSPENAERLFTFIRQRTDPKLTHDGHLEVKPAGTQGVCITTADSPVIPSDTHESLSGRVRRRGVSQPAPKQKGEGGKSYSPKAKSGK